MILKRSVLFKSSSMYSLYYNVYYLAEIQLMPEIWWGMKKNLKHC